MNALVPSSEPIRLKLAKQLFRDGWMLTIDKDEYGELRFGSLRLKASGKSADGDYELKKEKHAHTVIRAGTIIASYEDANDGKGTLADGSEFQIGTEVTTSLPGHGIARLVASTGETIVWTETTWNSLGVAHCDLIIEPGTSGDRLWGAIFVLLRIVVDHGLWNVSRDAATKAFVSADAIRHLLGS